MCARYFERRPLATLPGRLAMQMHVTDKLARALIGTVPVLLAACTPSPQPPAGLSDEQTMSQAQIEPEPQRHSQARAAMVQQQLAGRDITNPAVLAAMQAVPRQHFVPPDLELQAYLDRPLPIGHGQTISQPYIVALMSQLAAVDSESHVLDVGTGCGYQAAVLAEICAHVVSIEILEPLATTARQRLQGLGYDNVEVHHGDGYRGYPSSAPFDAIVVAAAPLHVPQPLIDQLAIGGKLVIPVGDSSQQLLVIEKLADGSTHQRQVAPVSFVPMTGPLGQP